MGALASVPAQEGWQRILGPIVREHVQVVDPGDPVHRPQLPVQPQLLRELPVALPTVVPRNQIRGRIAILAVPLVQSLMVGHRRQRDAAEMHRQPTGRAVHAAVKDSCARPAIGLVVGIGTRIAIPIDVATGAGAPIIHGGGQ